MQWTVYILQCADGTLYTGITNDLTKRLTQHNSGVGAKYTRNRLPVTLVWHQQTKSKSEALKEEIRLKKLTREQKLRFIVDN